MLFPPFLAQISVHMSTRVTPNKKKNRKTLVNPQLYLLCCTVAHSPTIPPHFCAVTVSITGD